LRLLAPSILSADFSRIKDEIQIVESAGADMLHLDVMDGHFVPNITFGPKMVSDVNKITNLPLDVHLMISEPDKYIAQFAGAGADWISVHFEAAAYSQDKAEGSSLFFSQVGLRRAAGSNPTNLRLVSLLNRIKDNGCKAGAVINPATSVDVLDDVVDVADYILIMSVNPGFGGQKFIESALDKATKLRSSHADTIIEMDGGIGLDNIEKVRDAGVNVFVCGNSIFASKDPVNTVQKMKALINEKTANH
jgi:ribulose-phosphate 3-epimerase